MIGTTGYIVTSITHHAQGHDGKSIVSCTQCGNRIPKETSFFEVWRKGKANSCFAGNTYYCEADGAALKKGDETGY
ncbi:MAG TPA: hypothetical protein VEA59_02790 [Patescibacteria group bacterium]|nr:hypothetical protein [Patescibacteria group bacterium]